MSQITYQQYLLTHKHDYYPATEDIIAFILPLFEEVLSFHLEGKVAPFENSSNILIHEDSLDIAEQFSHAPKTNLSKLKNIIGDKTITGFRITETLNVTDTIGVNNREIRSGQVDTSASPVLTQPVYIKGYKCYELLLEHHDEQTDIFCLGLLMAGEAMGLNLFDEDDVEKFALHRQNPIALNPRLHPTLGALITEMTELDRSDRARDLKDIINRVKHYRDVDTERTEDLSQIPTLKASTPTDRNEIILSKLRNRLFDNSRRNRLLYYKPNSRFVNLTVGSVPNVLRYQSIKPETLITWNDNLNSKANSLGSIVLNKYLRFEDHPYLAYDLNNVRKTCESDEREFGFSQLRLVIAFLYWYNFKEDTNERIESPLLLLPVRLKRKKSVREEIFNLEFSDNEAIINPVLSNQLRELYGIQLPESISLDEVTVEQFYLNLKSILDQANQGIKLNLIDKPRIKIIHHSAKQIISRYQKKLDKKMRTGMYLDYSYRDDDFRPLGLQIFTSKVKPQIDNLDKLIGIAQPNPTENNFSTETRTSSTFELASGENNAFNWEYDICNIVLGNFNYKKMSLVSDYYQILDNKLRHPVFEKIFSNEPRQWETTNVSTQPADWYHVIAADSTQANAVAYSRTGDSYIIQGPPGTGKSQTITNLIADYLALGKNVLFVCEKRAALDVVYHRLQQNNLDELCCYIHNSQEDKKEFFRDLKTVYEDFVKTKMSLSDIEKKRNEIIQTLMSHIQTLELNHENQNKVFNEAGISTHELLQTLLELRHELNPWDESSSAKIQHYHNWIQHSEAIQNLETSLKQNLQKGKMTETPFKNVSPQIASHSNPETLVSSIGSSSELLLQEVRNALIQNSIPEDYQSSWNNIVKLIESTVKVAPLAAGNNISLINPESAKSIAFDSSIREHKQLENALGEKQKANIRWKNKFEKDDTILALEIAKQKEKSFFKFLSKDWRRLSKQLKSSYDFAAHQIHPLPSTVLQSLKEEYEATESFEKKKVAIESEFMMPNLRESEQLITHLRGMNDKDVQFIVANPANKQLVQQLSSLDGTIKQLQNELNTLLYEPNKLSVDEISQNINGLKQNVRQLKSLLPALIEFFKLPNDLQNMIRQLPATASEFRAAMADKTLKSIYASNPQFEDLSTYAIEHAAKEIGNCYSQLREVNSLYIRAKRRQIFSEHYDLSNTSVTQLNDNQRALKKEYSEGRRIIEHEINKSMRYKSIREMASGSAGKVLKDLKPVWLMSPLSVSDSIHLNQNFFDVVIFDEASQINLEEGIPAMFRAPQSIVVGDDKQMPPSNFFNSVSQDPDDFEYDEPSLDDDDTLVLDADSLLVQAARKLNSTMLSWHYRSRYEALISYSNHAFYQASLYTIPDKTSQNHAKEPIVIKQTEEANHHAQRLLQESMSFHYLPEAVYELRSNMMEANYIAELVRSLLLKNIKETIGIVAFSQEQQGTIESAIYKLAETDKEFDAKLNEALNRTDDGQFTGLFIKNLENVQGDERDIIIMSVCYGPDANRKMRMNFGPINRKGGERRLNVIFSRAKKHMAVVSSIKQSAITNTYNDGANYLRRFLQYAEAVCAGNMSQAKVILAGLSMDETKKTSRMNITSIVTKQLKEKMESLGYFVEDEIGQSSFKCNIGIKRKAEDKHYSLGILIDDDSHYANSNLLEQYYQRADVMRNFGWKVISVFAKDWLSDNEAVMERVVKSLNESTNE